MEDCVYAIAHYELDSNTACWRYAEVMDIQSSHCQNSVTGDW